VEFAETTAERLSKRTAIATQSLTQIKGKIAGFPGNVIVNRAICYYPVNKERKNNV
jgi:hypothetical protein